MLLVPGLMAMVIGMMLVFPETEIGRGLNRWLIEMPARRLNRVGRGKAVFCGMLAILGLMLVLLFEAEGMRLFGFLLPDTLMWFAMFDVGVFVDALLITAAILATNGLRAIRAQATALPRQVSTIIRRCAARARRVSSSSRPTRQNADDDGPAGSVHPAYRAFSIA
ncbi:hypothetical protein HZ989_01025 [Brevundimonas sp. AJA228-03]|uniref:hypothetical protein n=1 Tax=Brevundimonas sp. AJA228-03 TaxID=2752515 RepID=UPI001AE08297|nr:hypothetical protein [Brevundimonas sp. AJA228-03]QTN19696.1 hypothetical protein HZ989_01025 [Brevundimonas sp. AJA228-03]